VLTTKKIRDVVNQIQYKDWEFYIGGSNQRPYLQIRFLAVDSENPGVLEWQHCRKWWLSRYMIPSEILRTAWKAVLAAEEHEAGERFTYKGVALFNPHADLDALAEHMRVTPLVSRPTPVTT